MFNMIKKLLTVSILLFSSMGVAQAATWTVLGGTFNMINVGGSGVSVGNPGQLIEGAFQGVVGVHSSTADAPILADFIFNGSAVYIYTHATGIDGVTHPAPSINIGAGTANLSSLYVFWNGTEFNQGSANATVTALPSPGAYRLSWTALIVGGPFNGFTGSWTMDVTSGAVPPAVIGGWPCVTVAGTSCPKPVIGTKNISITFDKEMDTSTVTSASLTLSPAVAVGTPTFTSDHRTFTFPLGASLVGFTTYTATVNSGPKDTSGLSASTYSWSFLTAGGGATDVTPPTIDTVTTTPANAAVGMAVNAPIKIYIADDRVLNVGAVVSASSLTAGGQAVPGYFTLSNDFTGAGATFEYILTFTPTAGTLNYNTVYTMSVGTGAKDVTDNALAVAFSRSFTTVASPASMTGVGATVNVSATAGVSLQRAPNVLTLPQVQAIYGADPITTGLAFVDGFVSYAINGVSGQAIVKITFPASIVDKTLFKAKAGGWIKIPESAFTRDPDGQSITMAMVDNGTYDIDPVVGQISDPIGAAHVPLIAGAGSSGSGGCTVNPLAGFDPALPGLLLVALGYLGWMRRRVN